MRVLAKAFVETLRKPTPFLVGKYRVEAVGEKPYDYVRIYELLAKDENAAAREGIDKFVDEMTAMSIAQVEKERGNG